MSELAASSPETPWTDQSVSPKAAHESYEAVAAGTMAAEFDRREIVEFGKDDGHAVTVIGKMLVGFFFYSLLVMIAVGYWTWKTMHAPAPTAAVHDTEESDE